MAVSSALALPASIVRRQMVNRLMGALVMLATLVALAPLVLVVGFVLVNGIKGLNLNLITRLPAPMGQLGGGLANAFVGTVMLVLLASAIGLPIGILAGIFLSELGHNRFADGLRFLTDVLTGVPSIIIGIVAYTLVVVPRHGFSALAGGVALSIIMIPVVTRTAEEALRRVPMAIREAAWGLGVHEWKTVLAVVLPAARGGIVTGAMLAIARISGETAPLLFTAFGSNYWQQGLDKPIAAVPLKIYEYAISPFKDWQTQAWAAALILMLAILVLNVGVRALTGSGFQKVL